MPTRVLHFGLIVLIVASQLLVLLAMISAGRYGMKHATAEQVGNSINQLSRMFSDNVTLYLQPAERAVSLIKTYMASDAVNSDDDRAIELLFIAELSSSPQISGLFIGREDGSFVFVHRNSTGYRTKVITHGQERKVQLTDYSVKRELLKTTTDNSDTYDPRTRAWYTQALTPDLPIWTDPYLFFSTKMPGITSSMRLAPKPSRRGAVLGADVELIMLSNHLKSISLGANGHLHLEDSKGNVIAHPAMLQWVQENGAGKLPTLSQLEKMLPTVAIPKSILIDDRIREIGEDSGQQGYLGAKKFLSPVSGVNWSLTMIAQTKDLTGSFERSLAKSAWWIFGASALTMLFAWFSLNRLMRPIKRIEISAHIDPLTGVYNRRGIEFALAESKAMVEKRPAMVMIIDLDGFKQINDQQGHDVGDRVLIDLSHRIQAARPKEEIFGRWGGDEFVAILPNVSKEQAAQSAEAWRTLASTPSAEAKSQVGVTLGYAFMNNISEFHEVLLQADLALVNGKRIQKNTCYAA